MSPRLATVVAFALALLPELAAACSVCTAGRDDETRVAFLVTTVFLSVLPLALIGGLVWWVRRRVRASEAGPPPPPSAGVPQRS